MFWPSNTQLSLTHRLTPLLSLSSSKLSALHLFSLSCACAYLLNHPSCKQSANNGPFFQITAALLCSLDYISSPLCPSDNEVLRLAYQHWAAVAEGSWAAPKMVAITIPKSTPGKVICCVGWGPVCLPLSLLIFVLFLLQKGNDCAPHCVYVVDRFIVFLSFE